MEKKLDIFNLKCGCKPFYLPGKYLVYVKNIDFIYNQYVCFLKGNISWCNSTGLKCINGLDGI